MDKEKMDYEEFKSAVKKLKAKGEDKVIFRVDAILDLINHIEKLEAKIKKLELQTIPAMQGELSVYRGMDKIAEEICRKE